MSPFASGWLGILVAELELTLGLWLIAGTRRRQALQAAMACFIVFACFNVVQVILGEESCGCFGVLHVDPKYVLVFDIACGAAIAICLRRVSETSVAVEAIPNRAPSTWQRIVFPASLMLVTIAAVTHWWLRPAGELFEFVQFDKSGHDFGTTHGGETLRHEFLFRNDWTLPIRIVKLQSSCSCTSAETVVGCVVASGETLRIPVTLKTALAEGLKSGSLTVYYRGVGQLATAWKTCLVKSYVALDYWVRPTLIEFGDVDERQPATHVVVLRPNKQLNADITSVECDNPAITARVRPGPHGTSDKIVELTFDASSFAADTPVAAKVRVNTNSRRAPFAEVHVHATPRPLVVVEPREIVVGSDQRGTVERFVELRTPSSASVRLDASNGVSARLATVDATGNRHRLTVNVPEGSPDVGLSTKVEITVENA